MSELNSDSQKVLKDSAVSSDQDLSMQEADPANDTSDYYLRLYDEYDKDYCFVLKNNQPVNSLYNIFKTIPFCLSPSYFYDSSPCEIKLSSHPGFLTTEGGILFTKDASKPEYLVSISQDAKIKDVAWDGQLFVPIWKFNSRRFYTIIAVLCGWLYLDLPQYITPTPGLAPTLLGHKLLDYWVPPSPELSAEDPAFNSVTWQWVFFVLHILKVLFIFMLFQTGSLNPFSLNPYNRRSNRKKNIDEYLLKSIGWTATRKSTINDWRLAHSKNVIGKVGVGYAHQNNLWSKIRFAGVYLDNDEGYAVKKNMTVIEREEFEKKKLANPSKFYISPKYFDLFYEPLARVFADPESTNQTKAEMLTYYRQNGPKEGPQELKEAYDKREKLRNKLIKEKKIAPEE